MRWPEALAGWPHAEMSRRIASRPHRWHVQEMGAGPLVLLLHGAGGANHSWRGVLPDLARDAHVVSLDLPGHGLTQLGSRARSTLDGVAEDILALCAQENWRPTLVVGHSAGGAVALRMAQLAPDHICRVMGVNAALDTFKGLAGVAFPVMAKMLSLTPFTADFFARAAAQPGRVQALIDSTGSEIGPDGVALYASLVGDRAHVDGTLLMMAQWSLTKLMRDLPKTMADVTLLAGANDRTVPAQTSINAAKRLANGRADVLPALGHLMQEEAPELISNHIRKML
ncbi:alpha/beta fold hydrolase BchO [Roseobacteraceae bacterium S113]